MLTIDKVFHASLVLKDIIRPTPLARAYGFSKDFDLYFKPENLQRTGSFKLRGSGYKIAMLSQEEKQRGVIACSAGNHAQGVALAASKCGISSLICLPDSAPISKVEATRGYGAQVELVPGVYDDAYARALQLRDERGLTFVHPFDDEYVIAGQGTIGLEIMNEMNDIDAVIVPIGGGGLIAGVACAIKSISPRVKVYGVQAAGAPSMYGSVKNGQITPLDRVSTIADGTRTDHSVQRSFEVVEDKVDDIVLAEDEYIKKAIKLLVSKAKIVAEPSSVMGVAAVLSGALKFRPEDKVCFVLSGGNNDLSLLAQWLAE